MAALGAETALGGAGGGDGLCAAAVPIAIEANRRDVKDEFIVNPSR
jgi:hypothetical protein